MGATLHFHCSYEQTLYVMSIWRAPPASPLRLALNLLVVLLPKKGLDALPCASSAVRHSSCSSDAEEERVRRTKDHRNTREVGLAERTGSRSVGG